MYEIITKYCEQLNSSDRSIWYLLDDLESIAKQHPEMNLNNYGDVLKEYGLEWSCRSIENANPCELDCRGILALLISAYRADIYANGFFGNLIERGIVQKWLMRLKELDTES